MAAERGFSVRLSARVDQYVNAMNQAKQATGDVEKAGGRDMARLGSSMQAVGRKASLYVTAPLVAAGGAGVKMAIDFDSSMTRIQSLVGFTADEVDGMRDSVRELSGRTAASPKELADALFFATSAGLDAADAMEAVEWAAKASAVGMGDTKTIVDLTTSAMNAYGADVLSAEQATDALTAAVRLGKLEPAQLAGAMGQVLPVASAMGVSFDEVGAAMAAMSRTGTSASQAGTQLRQIMATLLSPTEGARDAMESVGLSVEGVQQSLREDGLLSTLEMLVWSLGDNATASEAVFGNIRALSGVMDMLGGNVEDTRMIFGEMTNTAGATADAFDVVSETAGFKMQQAWADLQGALIDVGNVLLPFVTTMVEGVSSLASAFMSLPQPVQNILVGVAALAAAAGPLLIVFGSMIKNIVAIKGAMAALKVVMLGHPLFALAAIATAVGAAVYMMGNQASVADAQVQGLADAMKHAGDAGEGLHQFLTGLITGTPLLAAAMREADVTISALEEAVDAGGESFDRMRAKLLDGAEAAGAHGLQIEWLDDQIKDLATSNAAAVEDLRNVEAAMRDTGPSSQALTQSYIDQALEARKLSQATGELDETSEEFAEQQRILAAVTQAATDVIEAEFAAVEAAADALRNRVDSAMKSGAQSILKFSDEGKKSLNVFVGDLENSIERLTTWQDNLVTIAERGSAEFALQMSELGPEFDGVVDQIANATDDEFASAMAAMVGYTEQTQRGMADEFAKVDPEFKKTLDGLAGMTQLEMIYLEMQASQQAFAVGLALGDGMAAGVNARAGSLADTAAAAVTNAISAARNAAETGSPSKRMMREVGVPLGQGITLGMEKGAMQDRDRVVEGIIGVQMVGAFQRANITPAAGPVSNNSTGVVIEHAVFNDAADVDAVYRAANLSMAVA